MPFPDEQAMSHVEVVDYQPSWPQEAAVLRERLGSLVPAARAVEHIGSTSIPGMASKDCLDMMIVVDDLAASGAAAALTDAGFRERPEPWNRQEPAGGSPWPKQVFAPRQGDRSVNIHVRLADAPTTRNALLFRDFLRANPERAAQWETLKKAAAVATQDLPKYGAIKDPAWLLLMALADHWAAATGWAVPWTTPSRPRP